MTVEAPRFNCIDLPSSPPPALALHNPHLHHLHLQQPIASTSTSTSTSTPSSRSSLRCPPAPFLPSCHNFHTPSPIRNSTARFTFLDDLSSSYRTDASYDMDDLYSEGSLTPVQHQYPYSHSTGLNGSNLLGLFVDEVEPVGQDQVDYEEEERNKGVLRAALERLELDPRYMDVFEDDESFVSGEDDGEDYLTYNLDSPPALIRRISSSSSSDEYSSSSTSTTGGDEYHHYSYSSSPPLPTLTFGRFGDPSTRKIFLLDDLAQASSSTRSRSTANEPFERESSSTATVALGAVDDNVEILDLDDKAEREEAVEEGPYRYRRFREDDEEARSIDSLSLSLSNPLDPVPVLAQALGLGGLGMGGWRVPTYLHQYPQHQRGSRSGSGCSSTAASTPSFKSLTPVGWEHHSNHLPTSFSMGGYDHPQTDREDVFMDTSSLKHPNLARKTDLLPLSTTSRSGCTRRRSDDGLPEKRRKLEHRSARVIDGSLFA